MGGHNWDMTGRQGQIWNWDESEKWENAFKTIELQILAGPRGGKHATEAVGF
jgi:hypothetical protein